MKQHYFVVVLAHSLHGRLRRIHIPHQALYLVLGLSLFAHDPVMVSLAKPPPTFLDSVPEMFPAVSTLTLPAAAPGTGPVGRIRVPIRVNPHFPAALAFEHVSAACAAGATLRQRAATEIRSVVRAKLRFMCASLRIDFLKPKGPTSDPSSFPPLFQFGNYR